MSTRIRSLLARYLSLAFLLVFSATLNATETTTENYADQPETGFDADADVAITSLLRLLKTNISTRDRPESADETPGIVNILTGKDLRNIGVSTVRDALTLIAGIDLPEAQIARDEPAVRGVGGIYTGSSGKLRYMVDGLVTNNIVSGNSTETLDIPVEQVDRIEVIRGTGSALHGEYAYLGTINVVTYDKGDSIDFRATSFDGYKLGARMQIGGSDSVKSHLNVALSSTQGEKRMSGTDRMHSTGFPEVSNAPGRPHLQQQNYSLFYALESENLSLNAFALGKRREDGFGVSNTLSSQDDHVQIIDNTGLELNWKPQINQWDIDLKVAAKRFRREYDELEILPAGALGIYPDRLIANANEGEDRYEGKIKIGKTRGGHRLLGGFEFSHSQATDIHLEQNFDDQNPLPGPVSLPRPLPGPQQFQYGYEGRQRTVNSLFLSDQYNFSYPLKITFSLRFDDYSDVGSTTSPRINLSYRIDDKHLVKGQVSQAFRPPTFQELYSLIGSGESGPAGNPDLDVETVETVELTHVYRDSRLQLQSSVFSSKLDDLIRVDQSRRFTNAGGIRSNGAEIDFNYRSGPSLRWFGNVSYLDAVDTSTDSNVEGSAKWLANLGVVYRTGSRFSVVTRYRYVGERHRSPDDVRPTLDDYGIFNVALNYLDVFRPGITVRLGINNVLDSDTRNPAPARTYVDDYPGAGRELWLSVAREFR